MNLARHLSSGGKTDVTGITVDSFAPSAPPRHRGSEVIKLCIDEIEVKVHRRTGPQLSKSIRIIK